MVKSKQIRHKKLKKVLIIAAACILALAGICAAAFIRLQIRSNSLHDDYKARLDDTKYSRAVSVDGVEVITQDVSCGYAVIEMFAKWCGTEITEESLYAEYGKVVTSTGRKFRDEMNKRFPAYLTEIHKYLKDSELIGLAYESLERGVPVPFEWAAKYGEDWTLHYSLMIGMDIQNDTVTVANPYGYYEEISVEELLERTSFDAYEKMPLFFRLAFAFGIFEKNTVFLVE